MVSPKPTNFESVKRHPTTRTAPSLEVINDFVILLEDGRVLIEFGSFKIILRKKNEIIVSDTEVVCFLPPKFVRFLL
jgi:hypothetical protein